MSDLRSPGNSRGESPAVTSPPEAGIDTPGVIRSVQQRIVGVAQKITQKQKLMQANHHSFLARLQKLGIDEGLFIAAKHEALKHGSQVEEVLLASGCVASEAYFQAVAHDLDLPFDAEVRPELVLADLGVPGAKPGAVAQLFTRAGSGLSLLHIAPNRNAELAIQELVQADPEQRKRIRITTPLAIQTALESRSRQHALELARDQLYHERPEHSPNSRSCPGRLLSAVF